MNALLNSNALVECEIGASKASLPSQPSLSTDARQLLSRQPVRTRSSQGPTGVELLDVGIGGMVLVQALEQVCDLLILIDVFQRGGAPGTLYLLEPEVPELESLSLHEMRDYFADTHYATPMRALALARSLGRLPSRILIVGCEPEEADEMGIGLNPAVAAAVGQACARVKALIAEPQEIRFLT